MPCHAMHVHQSDSISFDVSIFFIATIERSRSAIHRFSRICPLLIGRHRFSSEAQTENTSYDCDRCVANFMVAKQQQHCFISCTGEKVHPIKILSKHGEFRIHVHNRSLAFPSKSNEKTKWFAMMYDCDLRDSNEKKAKLCWPTFN